MKTRSWAGFLGLALMLAAGITMAPGTAQAAPQYAMGCDSCHNMPPVDSGSATKNPYTGGVPGNHATHAPTATKDNRGPCVNCHDAGILSYDNSHRNKTIELKPSLGYDAKRAFLNQTSVPPNPLGSCATAACHNGNGKWAPKASPVWGDMTPANCSTCHSATPGTNKHSTHISTYGFTCDKCHSNHTTFEHATSAMWGRAIDVHFSTAPNSGGTFTGNADSALASCTAIYCHSDGKASPSYKTPTWGGTAGCTDCHDGASSGTTLSGKHEAHIFNATVLGTNYGCVNCHAQTVSSNTDISTPAKHVNGTRDMTASFDCASCHQSGKTAAGIAVSTPVTQAANWTDGTTLGCAGCHGTAGTFGAPAYGNGGVDTATANSHDKHATSAATCASCHSKTTTTGTAIIAGSQHLDSFINFTSGNGATFGKTGTKTCADISCHSGEGKVANVKTIKWGTASDCSNCHDLSVNMTAAHSKHVTDSSIGCATCHNATVTGNSTLVGGNATMKHGVHMDDSITVPVTATITAWTPATASCTATCHLSAAPKWTDATTGQCGSCHAADSGHGAVIATNAHNTHFNATYGPNMTKDITGCQVCHSYSSETGHVNNGINMALGYAKDSTCGGCHQQSTGAGSWSAAAHTLSCEKCHTTPVSVINTKSAPVKDDAATLGHGSQNFNGTSNKVGCTSCHDNTSAHIGVSGGTTRLLGALGSGNTNCTSCHDDSSKVTARTLGMKAHGGPAGRTHVLGSLCSDCHDPHGINGNTMMVKSTINGTSGISFTGNSTFANGDQNGVCQVCHRYDANSVNGTKYFSKSGSTPQAHVESTQNCLECHKHNPTTGAAFSVNGGCDACHGYPPVPRSVFGGTALVAGTDFAKQGLYSSARFEDYSGGGGAHIVAKHVSPNVTKNDGFAPCLPCHAGADAMHARALPVKSNIANVTVQIDQKLRFADGIMAIYSSAKFETGANKTGSCFNVSCHFRPTEKWSIEK